MEEAKELTSFKAADLMIRKFNAGLTVAEEAELQQWLNNDPRHLALYEEMGMRNARAKGLSEMKRYNSEAAFQKLQKKLMKPQRPVLWPWLAAAATVLMVTGLGYYAGFFKSRASMQQSARLSGHNIKPGGNKAYLTLASGEKLSLTDAANGTIAQQAGIRITKTANGQIIYTTKTGTPPAGLRHALNTIETPRGGQYQLQLPDGSKVWLNAASTLTYPVSFAAQKERKVTLTGEAYFEVAKDKAHPFKVKNNDQEVEVLGTHFNINAYTDEPAVKTTLLEGSVRITSLAVHPATSVPPVVNPARSAHSIGNSATSPPYFKEGWPKAGVVLKPSQQSILTQNEIKVTEVNPALAIAWKNGEFRFKNEALPAIMRKISRWYDVKIEYESNKSIAATFTGSISKFDQVSAVLELLEKTGDVKFAIEGKTIRIK